MDVVTMAMAKPKRINLSKIKVSDGGEAVTLNDVVEAITQIAMMNAVSNGVDVESVDISGASEFWSAVNTKKPIFFIGSITGNEFDAICSVIRADGKTAQIGVSTTFFAGTAVCDMAYCFQGNSSDSDKLHIVAKATLTPVSLPTH